MFVNKKRKSRGKKNELYKEGATELVFLINDMLGQHRTIPALRLKHRSGSCGTSLAVSVLRIMRYCPNYLLTFSLAHPGSAYSTAACAQ